MEYEVQQTPPSGSYSSYHSSGTGHSGPAYSPPHPPVHHAPKSTSPSKKKKKKSSAGSVMSALTLLSFFFFVNMLQNCIKEHIADINPTVMVLTASGSRNRFNKLAEMNSREQASSPASTTASSVAVAAAAAASSWQQAALAPVPPAVSSVVAPIIVTPAVTLHTPYSSGLVTNKPASHSHYAPQQQHHHYHQQQQPDDDYNYGHRTPYAAATPAPAATLDFYPNRTHIDHSLRPDSDYYQQQQQNQQQQQQQQSYYPHEGDRQHYMNRDPAWSYGAMDDSSHLASHPVAPFSYAAGSKRYSSSASLGAQSGVSSYSDNARYRQQDDYDHHQHRHHQHQHHHHRYNINARHDELDDDDDVDNGDADHRRRGITDDFYTRNN